MRRFVSPVLLAGLLAGCALPPAPEPSSVAAGLKIEQFLAGRTLADGVFRNSLTGKERRLHAILDGSWDDRTLTLREEFRFDDGARDRKTWRLTRNPDGTWTGLREDVIGTAKGVQDGASFRLSYEASLASQGSDTIVHFEDVLTLTDRRTVLNKAVVSKFGVAVGEVTLTIRR